MMNSDILFRVGILAATVAMGLGSHAVAESKSAVPPAAAVPKGPSPVDAQPFSTSASFGDWVLRCQRIGNGAETQHVCEVAQQIRAQDQQSPVAELAIGHLKKADALRLTVVLPVNVTLANPPSLSTDGKTVEPLDLGWRKCMPGGCIADALLKDDVLGRWKAQTSTGRMHWTDAAGRDLAIGLSFRGLAQALDALGREP